MPKTVILSLGGSLIVPDEIDTEFLKQFKALILSFISKGNRAAIICGGGRTCRKYYAAASKVSKIREVDFDWIGIASTKLNAEMVRSIFGSLAHDRVIDNYDRPLKTSKKIIIGCGHRPGHSTDYDAVLMAKKLKSKEIINLSNIDYVYDKDPKKHPDAKPIKSIAWSEVIRLAGKWKTGMHTPFDPEASKQAKNAGLRVIIANGNDLDNVKAILEGRRYKGTLIS
ncbi:UMP kinase [Candidatus Woesearchaeota archaeon]|nr:UMP kinase [Candidatus Woesearchaeota archaeon]